MHVAKYLAAASTVAVVMLAGCSRGPAPAPAPADTTPAAKADAGWPAFVDSFIESRFKADPYFAVQAGRHEFDGKMPDWSRAALDADVAELREFQTDLARFDPAALTPPQRFEHEYLQWVVGRAVVLAGRAPNRRIATRPGISTSSIHRCTSRANTRHCRSASKASWATRARCRRWPPTSAPTCARRCPKHS